MAKGVLRWVPGCGRFHEGPEGLEREVITGRGGGQIIHLVDKHSLSTYSVPGIVLGAGDADKDGDWPQGA